MTRLEELLYSLTTIIVRYHDSQEVAKKLVDANIVDHEQRKVASRAAAVDIINDPVNGYEERLAKLIKACTDDINYPLRIHLLTFVLHEVTYIKSLIDRKASFSQIRQEKESPSEYEEFENQLVKLLTDLKTLTYTAKNSSYKVTYTKTQDSPEKGISLKGLTIPATYLSRGGPCNSGGLLIEEILDTLNLTTADAHRIKAIAKNICEEFQNSRLVPEQQEQIKLEKAKAAEQADTLEQQKLLIAEQAASLESQKLLIAEQAASLESQKSLIDKQALSLDKQVVPVDPLKAQLEEALARVNQLQEDVQKRDQTISGLRTQISTSSQGTGARPNPLLYNPAFGFGLWGSRFGLTQPTQRVALEDFAPEDASSTPSPGGLNTSRE